MNQRQLARSMKLVDVLTRKILTKEPKEFANSCINACGTKGCVWGDFAIAMRAVDTKRLRKAAFDVIHGGAYHDLISFNGFNRFINNSQLRAISKNMIEGGDNPNVTKNYFGLDLPIHDLFGTQFQGSWTKRYKIVVQQLASAGHDYNPLELKV